MSGSKESPVEAGPDPKDLITREFLENALKKEGLHADHDILSFEIQAGSKPGDNYMSLIYSIDLKLKAPSGNTFTRYWLIKCYPNHPGRQQFTNKMNIFYKELQVYSEWIPELQRFQKEVLGLKEGEILHLPYVKYVHGDCIDFESKEGSKRLNDTLSSLDNYIIMEDAKKTRGFQMLERKLPMEIDHMNLAIEALAKVHAISWAYKKHVEENLPEKFSCFKLNFEDEDIEMFSNVILGAVKSIKEVLVEKLGAENKLMPLMSKFEENGTTPFRWFARMLSDHDMEKLHRHQIDKSKYPRGIQGEEIPWKVIVHGDCWSNNMLFRYDQQGNKVVEIILLDLQAPSETCVVSDLEYVIYAGPCTETRKKEMDNWLQLYHDTFINMCKLFRCQPLPDFNMNELRYRFHRAKPFGYYMGLMLIMGKLKENVTDIETMDKDAKFDEMLNQIAVCDNEEVKVKIVEYIQEVYDEGIF